jgi:hypothetical protein
VLELDHLIVFRRGPGDVDVAGLVLDEGTRHVGQGTRNRRIVFPDSYIELLWVDSPGEARASGLRFEERCTGDACPFGVVFRGRLPETVDLVEYTVPAGPTLLVGDDPRTPFLAVHEADDLERLRPARRMAPERINSTTAIEHVELACGTAPPDLVVPRVSFVLGGPMMTVTLTGSEEPLRFHPDQRPAEGGPWG